MNWKIKKSNSDFGNILSEKYNPVILRILANRGIEKEEEIEKYFNFDYEKDLGDPLTISQMEKAVDRIISAKEKKEKIAIFGDYDADGVTACAVLYEGLAELGFSNLICYIPDRQLEGYGMNEEAIDYIAKLGVGLVITVDCGISNYKEIEKAKEKGMDVIITDHHHIPREIPKAYCVINPNIKNSGFACQNLAGVGVAFKLVEAIYQKNAPEKKEQLKWMLDLVAIGTIADCVPLLGENRILARYGLIVISKTRRVGLKEMFKVGKIDISQDSIPDAHKIAFQVAPRINAAGRMDHANVSYNLLIEKNEIKARDMALEVESKNQERQKITKEIMREVEVLAQNSFKDKKFIFAENAHWPVGILGLVAGKIADKFQKPIIVLQKREDELAGSLRSIPEINIIKIIEKCSDLLLTFGGHSQAAGVSLKYKNAEKFYKKMSDLVEKELKGKEISPSIDIDCEISPDDINWELISALKKMEPFGNGNEEPVFYAKNMSIRDLRIVGNGQKHFKLNLHGCSGSPKIFDAIGFSLVEKFPNLKIGDKIDIVFNVNEDEWNGNHKIQLKLIDLKLV
jgi:single-stranded-DNA-specific exonuclease